MADTSSVILITGAAGNIGSGLAQALKDDFTVVGLDIEGDDLPCDFVPIDLTDDESTQSAIRTVREDYGEDVAAVFHLAAFFDFTGEDHPAYKAVNEEGTRRLLRELRQLNVEQFVYSGTMLVHRPGRPGEKIDESTPIEPKWAYPQSKARTEDIIREEHGDIPVVLLHLAGLYDEETAVPTLSHQIARIYERDIKSRFYPGDQETGQAFIHRDDIVEAFLKTLENREKFSDVTTLLVGEEETISYGELQNMLGELIHGEEDWETLKVPDDIATGMAWLEEKTEPLVPDAFDQGEKPFIRPFMVEMSNDHYDLDISRAKDLIGFEPKHSLREVLPEIVESLKRDPERWYEKNGITPPPWMDVAEDAEADPERVRSLHERLFRAQHRRNLWAHFVNAGLGAWLMVSPPTMGYTGTLMGWSDIASGLVVTILALLSISWRAAPVRWLTAAVGLWVMFAPLAFWTPSAAAYLNGTIVGALVMGFSVLVRPLPGISPVAAVTGPTIPKGWDFSPSTWHQRAPIIILAFVGLFISRYLTAYQLGHIDSVWEPFFTGTLENKNGTEQVITSAVSEAWPVPDAGLGALTYMLEILTGLIGSARRWRTIPWLVFLFGIMIVPLGIVSITFIIIQPIVIGTWCSLCLIQAAAMLGQIPYSLDELVATGQFLVRRKKAGRSLLRVFLFGDTDEGNQRHENDNFERRPTIVVKDFFSGGVYIPWSLAIVTLVGIWLMFTRLTLGAEGLMADADHLIGSLVITFTVIAFAEVGRPARFVNIPLGLALLVTPFAFGADVTQTIASIVSGALIVGLSIPRRPIYQRYGTFNRFLK